MTCSISKLSEKLASILKQVMLKGPFAISTLAGSYTYCDALYLKNKNSKSHPIRLSLQYVLDGTNMTNSRRFVTGASSRTFYLIEDTTFLFFYVQEAPTEIISRITHTFRHPYVRSYNKPYRDLKQELQC